MSDRIDVLRKRGDLNARPARDDEWLDRALDILTEQEISSLDES